jgi:hypothetical protein
VVDLNFSTTAAGQIARRSLGNRRSVQRRLVRLDGRLKPAQEIKSRVATYRKVIGQAARDPLVLARIVEVAELETLTAQIRADVLNGEVAGSVWSVLTELTRFTNTIARLRQGLGLNTEPIEPSLQALLEEDE